MKKILFFITLSVSLLIIVSGLQASDVELSKGDSIRITAPEYFGSLICRFEKIQSDSFYFSTGGRYLGMPLEHIQKVEILAGKKRNTVKGVVSGTLLGGAFLGIAMHAAEENAEGWSKVGQPGFWGGAAAGSLIGGAIGFLFGYRSQSDQWKTIPLNEKAHSVKSNH